MRVIGVVPTTENMPGGRAIKPGDVLTSARGKTVEVINTDAEGRLILGDGLWYARQLGATHLVDVATLTGARRRRARQDRRAASSARRTPGSSACARRRIAPAIASWPMPLFDDYSDQIKSEIADLMNTGGRRGRLDHRGDVPEGVRRRPAVGAPRHRRHGVGRRGEAVSAQGTERRRGQDAGRRSRSRGSMTDELLGAGSVPAARRPIIVKIGQPAAKSSCPGLRTCCWDRWV